MLNVLYLAQENVLTDTDSARCERILGSKPHVNQRHCRKFILKIKYANAITVRNHLQELAMIMPVTGDLQSACHIMTCQFKHEEICTSR